ncbi:MAG TPA: outer spore coat protein CotE [Mollicutes bacterium]|nr:outer spore coat protein CotE [Mollicutes bacterium]
MGKYREIVTKAVVGKGKKYFKNKYSLKTEALPSTVLGCWVINHKFRGYKTGDRIMVDGSFDVNIWYSYDDDSKTGVVSKTIDYSEVVNIKAKEEAELSGDTEIIVRALKQPNCTNVEIKDGIVEYEIEKELGIELVGDTKVKISIEEDEEPWDIIEDEVTEEVDKEIEEAIDENFIN